MAQRPHQGGRGNNHPYANMTPEQVFQQQQQQQRQFQQQQYQMQYAMQPGTSPQNIPAMVNKNTQFAMAYQNPMRAAIPVITPPSSPPQIKQEAPNANIAASPFAYPGKTQPPPSVNVNAQPPSRHHTQSAPPISAQMDAATRANLATNAVPYKSGTNHQQYAPYQQQNFNPAIHPTYSNPNHVRQPGPAVFYSQGGTVSPPKGSGYQKSASQAIPIVDPGTGEVVEDTTPKKPDPPQLTPETPPASNNEDKALNESDVVDVDVDSTDVAPGVPDTLSENLVTKSEDLVVPQISESQSLPLSDSQPVEGEGPRDSVEKEPLEKQSSGELLQPSDSTSSDVSPVSKLKSPPGFGDITPVPPDLDSEIEPSEKRVYTSEFMRKLQNLPSTKDRPVEIDLIEEIIQKNAPDKARSFPGRGGKPRYPPGYDGRPMGATHNMAQGMRDPRPPQRGRGRGRSRGRGGPTLPLSEVKPLVTTDKGYKIAQKDTMTPDEIILRESNSLLNKLSLDNFGKLSDKLCDVKIDSTELLDSFIKSTFEKALEQPHYAEMYAKLCFKLAGNAKWSFKTDAKAKTFKRCMLQRCQAEFETIENYPVLPDNYAEMDSEEQEYHQMLARRRVMGNIKFIGELYKYHMLTERIMHVCINRLIKVDDPMPLFIEAVCKLLRTIGAIMEENQKTSLKKTKKDNQQPVGHYLTELEKIRKQSPSLDSRLRFMIDELISLRNAKWQERRKETGPMTIAEVQAEAKAKQAAAQRVNIPMGRQQYGRPSLNPLSAASSSQPPPGMGMMMNMGRGGNTRPTFHRGPQAFSNTTSSTMSDSTSTSTGGITLGPQSKWSSNKSSDGPLGAMGRGVGFRPGGGMPATIPAARSVIPPKPQPAALDENTLKRKTDNILKEYCQNHSLKDTRLDLDDLGEVNRGGFADQALLVTLNTHNISDFEKMLELFLELHKTEDLSKENLVSGLKGMIEQYDDIVMDAPFAADRLVSILSAMIQHLIVPMKFLSELKPLIETKAALTAVLKILKAMVIEKDENWVKAHWTESKLELSAFYRDDQNDEEAKDRIEDMELGSLGLIHTKSEPVITCLVELSQAIENGASPADVINIVKEKDPDLIISPGQYEPNLVTALLNMTIKRQNQIGADKKAELKKNDEGRQLKPEEKDEVRNVAEKQVWGVEGYGHFFQTIAEKDEELQLSLLFTAQHYCFENKWQPSGLISRVFENLEEQGIIVNESVFMTWYDDPKSDDDKDEAKKLTSEFFDWLKTADEDLEETG